MPISRLECLSPRTRNDVDAGLPPLPPARAKNCPAVDVMRANPVSYFLTRVLAPGLPSDVCDAPDGPRTSRRLMLAGAVHCETMRGCGAAAGKRCIVLFHGNNNDALDALAHYEHLRNYGDLIAVNSPGYGDTPPPKTHRQTEWQMAANVRLVSAHVARHYAPSEVVWLGFSLGSAQAAMAFQEMPGSHLMLEAPFTKMKALVNKHVPDIARVRRGGWLAGVLVGCGMAGLPKHWRVPGSAFLTDGLDTEAKLQRCAATHPATGSRLGIVFAERDEIMGDEMPRQLWQAYHGVDAPPDYDVVHCLEGVGHNGSLSRDPDVRRDAHRRHQEATGASVAKLFGVAPVRVPRL